MNSALASWLATFTCMVFSARLANAFLRSSPRLYTAMALLACCWAILLPYYSDDTIPTNLFRAISGFLLVYIGGLLMLEAQHISSKHEPETIVPWQVAGLWLLLLVAAPPLGKHLNLFFNEKEAEFAIGIVLDIAGFLSIMIGTYRLCGAAAGVAIGIVLTTYAAGELAVAYKLWGSLKLARGTLDIPENVRYAFAAGKLIIAATFGSVIAYKGMEERVRKRGIFFWTLKFIGLVN